MYQTIHEKVAVAGVYNKTRFTPKKLKWKGRELEISKITFVNDFKDGGVRSRMYSVMAGGNLYRLNFNRETEIWTLEEMWYEG
ncbi:MAG TPA: hypothetical protein VFG51_02455 [Candidatus Saccharimonadia bacterium]|nr:hypothetical protein [Candidatus Saccharimonadia bacterium]